MEKILREILAEDATILARRDDLISALNEKVPLALKRDYTPIKKALELNVGEIFATGCSDRDAAAAKAVQILKDSGMSEARINFVVETFVKALDWDKIPAEPEEPQEEFIENVPPPVEIELPAPLPVIRPEPTPIQPPPEPEPQQYLRRPNKIQHRLQKAATAL